jgi:hypothetical protein
MEDQETDEADPEADEEYGKDGEEGKEEDESSEEGEKEKSAVPEPKGKAVRCSAVTNLSARKKLTSGE